MYQVGGGFEAGEMVEYVVDGVVVFHGRAGQVKGDWIEIKQAAWVEVGKKQAPHLPAPCEVFTRVDEAPLALVRRQFGSPIPVFID
jgi:hypothetical protein